jgi:serine/threonine-protein kinase
VHRDVSPQNVVVTFSGDVKLVDFGIAKSVARSGDDTESGRLKGKVAYMSPEQARGEPIDARSDVFAAGVILFELTTGRRLFKAANEYETLRLICDRAYPLPSEVLPGYPPALEAIVVRALAKERAERWQSAREMQEALEEFVRQSRVPAARSTLSHFMRSLFAEQLALHEEALLEEKRLADRLAATPDAPDVAPAALRAESTGSLRPSTLGPSTQRTVTDARVLVSRPPARVAFVIGLFGAAAIVSGAAFSLRHPALRGGAADRAMTGAASARGRGAIAVASSPAGAAIFINGISMAQTTPATFNNLALGTPYVVTLTAPGFGAKAETVRLSDETPSGAVSLVLAPSR